MKTMIALAALAVAAVGISATSAKAESCSSYVNACVAQGVALGAKPVAYRVKCRREALKCNKTGMFKGPTTQTVYATGVTPAPRWYLASRR